VNVRRHVFAIAAFAILAAACGRSGATSDPALAGDATPTSPTSPLPPSPAPAAICSVSTNVDNGLLDFFVYRWTTWPIGSAFDVLADDTCDWTIVIDDDARSWLAVDPTQGAGHRLVRITIQRNDTPAVRTATLRINGTILVASVPPAVDP
jgi:hypothetical protein